MNSEDQRFRQFFRAATSFEPYEWQVKAAVEGLPDILPIPTGLGKTEGSVLAWAWRGLARKDSDPLHLVYCLPMRSLVRQTSERLRVCFENLKVLGESIDVSVHTLIGGDADETWVASPDRPWVLVGTQDMLLSRALNRGYGMNRFDWPLHFGLLNQDCHWIVDEVQLMGPGLWATAQLDWMRLRRFRGLKPCRTTWMSATMGEQFLRTVDRRRDGIDSTEPFDPALETDTNEQLRLRRAARRRIELHTPEMGKKTRPVIEQIASDAVAQHKPGMLTLIVCNTVATAQDMFQRFDRSDKPTILLTSRFRAVDRGEAEEALRRFESRRATSGTGRIEGGDPGLICISTQVIEAGLDISAHRLWTEHAPWPSLIQRLGRLNRDGMDNEARAIVWRCSPEIKRKHEGEDWVGPYRKAALDRAFSLLKMFAPLSEPLDAAEALSQLQARMPKDLAEALAISPEPCPRALDVHGLFSTEPDLHGGFTDVSRFVRNDDADADLMVFWRDWVGRTPPSGEALEGPPLGMKAEACSVPAVQVEAFLKNARTQAWIWNDRTERWAVVPTGDLRPGMTVMLHGGLGGYSKTLGWTGNSGDRLADLPPPGAGRALPDDQRAEAGYWSSLASHLLDARREAEQLCDALALQPKDPKFHSVRSAVVEAAGLHDLGKAHPNWRGAVPYGGPLDREAVAKFPTVLRVEALRGDAEAVRSGVESGIEGACPLPDEVADDHVTVRLRWALARGLDRGALEKLRAIPGTRKAVHQAFRPGLRHEAASALAMWRHHRDSGGNTPYPALAIYLAATHHGKVRTVMKATSRDGGDIFGVNQSPASLQFGGRSWPMEFSVASDGAEGDWTDDGFALTGHGWTGLVADLLGPWRGEADAFWVGAVPKEEPRALGPFALAWLEALVRVADWRASEHPSGAIRPGCD